MRPEDFKHFPEGVLLPEPLPPQAGEKPGWRIDGDAFDVAFRVALFDENAICRPKEVFGMLDATDGSASIQFKYKKTRLLCKVRCCAHIVKYHSK